MFVGPHKRNPNSQLSAHFQQQYMATVPPGGYAGQNMTTSINGKTVTVKIPAGVSPGQIFRFRESDCVLATNPPNYNYNNMSTPQQQPVAAGGSTKFNVTIPPGVFPNQQFQVNCNGTLLTVTCPLTGEWVVY